MPPVRDAQSQLDKFISYIYGPYFSSFFFFFLMRLVFLLFAYIKILLIAALKKNTQAFSFLVAGAAASWQ